MAYKIEKYFPLQSTRLGILVCGMISAGLYGGALIFQHFLEFNPCSLCLWQRWPHIIILMLAVISIFVSKTRFLLIGITLTAWISVALASYHVGVEWGFWNGPSGCSAYLDDGENLSRLTDKLLATPVVRCDEVVWSFLGLSMAGWNAVFSLDIFLIALFSLRQERKFL